jgi:alanine racemase
MKLNYSLQTIAKAINTSNTVEDNSHVDVIFYDTRKIYTAEKSLFFCLKSERRDGHDFIEEAYHKGIRNFVVQESYLGKVPKDCVFLYVKDTLYALQELAKFHRSHFVYPVIGITGSTGKTTVKEWLYQLLRDDFKIIRSPKSYNSQLGVALSLLEMSSHYDLAIIEAGISKPSEMKRLEEMIQPTLGVLTNIGTAHRENFKTPDEIFTEKIKLFQHCEIKFLGASTQQFQQKYAVSNYLQTIHFDKSDLQPWTATYLNNLELTASIVTFLTQKEVSATQLNQLPQLAMRMEVF